MGLFNFFYKKKRLTSEEYYNYLLNIKEINTYSYEKEYANQENILYDIYGNANAFNKKIKLMIITDTHNSLDEEKFKEFVFNNSRYDICLLLGDHGNNDLNIILKYIDKNKIYALLGNHDYDYITEYGLKNLNGNIIDVNGVKLLGIQGSFRYKPVNFPSFSQKESIMFLNDKVGVDILVSHDTKFRNEAYGNPAHQGLFGITYYLFKNKVPYHIHGHIHEPYRKEMVNGTKEISSYMYEFVEL